MAASDSPDTPPPAGIVVEHLSKVVRVPSGDAVVLESISFAVPAGSFFAVAGPSGSGKTALLHLLCGMDRPTGGRIVVGGRRLAAMDADGLARWRGRATGLIFHDSRLIRSLSARENISLALELGHIVPRSDWQSRVAECLAQVEMQAFGERFPDELSAEHQLRIVIARALANRPPLLLADEPAAGQHVRPAREAVGLLQELAGQGRTVVCTGPDLNLADKAEDYIVLCDGRIEDRSYSSLPGLYA